MGSLRLSDGKAPPFGAQVVSEQSGRTLGMVGDDGLTYLAGISEGDRQALAVTWNGQVQCRLTLPEKLSLNQGPLLLPCR